MLYLNGLVQWTQSQLLLNGAEKLHLMADEPAQMAMDAYKQLGLSYPKFYKMDVLAKVAYIGTELLHAHYTPTSSATDIGIMLATRSGCIAVDKKFEETMAAVASPALFVYTLPNIMLGELSIRFGYKGEQLCSPVQQYDLKEQLAMAEIVLQHTDTKELLLGYVNADDSDLELLLFWVSKEPRAESQLLNNAQLLQMQEAL